MKWEDNIKETLEKRTIEPSDTSWNALADRLDATDKKKGKVVYLWMGVAASVVAILFMITLFFNDNTFDTQNPVLVDTEQKMEEHIQPMEKSSEQRQLVKTNQEVGIPESFERNASKKELLTNEKNITTSTQQNLAVAKNENQESFESLEIIGQKETLEDQKVSEIVAQINDLKSKGQTVTDADIDALLQKAQREITFQTILKEGTRTVDASALLQDVETDLQKSFRDKIFEALKNSYETVITAVAERNN
ncbi:MAG: hypothetical protein ACOH2D_13405 [Gelidibacter sp.]|uniref:hypothetical protein n=1 Tax=Gelidibacter sp. TaxID=2018083 RepID=UPI00326679D1